MSGGRCILPEPLDAESHIRLDALLSTMTDEGHQTPRRERLVGWKEISAHLKKSARTVQRWERELGLPIRRIRTGPGQTVYAYADELDSWLSRQGDPGADSAALGTDEPVKSDAADVAETIATPVAAPKHAEAVPLWPSRRYVLFLATSLVLGIVVWMAGRWAMDAVDASAIRMVGSPLYLGHGAGIAVADSATLRIVRTFRIPDDAPFTGFYRGSVTDDGRAVVIPTHRADGVVLFDLLRERFDGWVSVADTHPVRARLSRDGKMLAVIGKHGAIAVIDRTTGRTLGRTAVPGKTFDIWFQRDGEGLIALSRDTGTLWFVDVPAMSVSRTLPTRLGTHDMVVSPSGETAIVSNEYDGSISCVDLARRRVSATISVGRNPISLAMSPDGRVAYVSNRDSHSVSVVDTASCSLSATIASAVPQSRPGVLATSHDGKLLFVAGLDSPRLAVYEVTDGRATLTGTIETPGEVTTIHAPAVPRTHE